MSIIGRTGAVAFAVALTLGVSLNARAQGVYTAAVQGTVRGTNDRPLANATVMLISASTGDRWPATSNAGGKFAIENVPVGGPYTLIARTVGYTPAQQTGIRLAIGQRYTADLTLQATTVQLSTVQISSSRSEMQDVTRTGPSTTITDLETHALPTIDRDFQSLLETAPEVSFSQGSLSVAGENNRFNNIQIDGAVNNDLFGLADNGLPGGQVGARAIPLEAVDQIQLQLAPFDVRDAGFTGGLVNVVTKSGTNDFHASVFEFFKNQSLVGENIDGLHIGDFATHEFGGSFSGPLVKNVAHFFLAIETRSTESPTSPTLGPNDALNIKNFGYSSDTANMIAAKAKGLGYNPGSTGAASLGNPNPIFFGKVDVQIAPGNTITVSENYVDGYNDNLSRSIQSQGAYDFSSNEFRIKDWNSTTRVDYASTFGGRFSNDLIGSVQLIRDNRYPFTNAPQTTIYDGSQGEFVFGAEEYSQDNNLNQDAIELTDNLTVALGDHHVTLGTHNEFYKFKNNFFPESYGQWLFYSPQDFLNGNPASYQIALPLRPGGPIAHWGANQFGGYLEDQWNPSERISLTGGLRLDVPIVPNKPVTNQQLLTETGINTHAMPDGQLEWSPRLGFNIAATRDRSTIIRGGTGLFQGRPAFVWLSDAFSNTGVDQTLLTCEGSHIPTYTPVASQQPHACVGAGAPPPVPTINYFVNNFTFPQVWRSAVGVDRFLGAGIIASLDGTYTITEHQLYIYDQNLKVVGNLAGEGNRPIYGTPQAGNNYTTPDPIHPDFGPILANVNRSGDYGYTITPAIKKTFGHWLLGEAGELRASYTYTQAFDRMSLSSSIAESNYQYNTFSGGAPINNRPEAPAEWSTPNQFKVSATNRFPLGFVLSLFYVGRSGTPYSYAVSSDISGTGVGYTHDLMYVPKNENDIDLANGNGTQVFGAAKDSIYKALSSYINSTSCLKDHIGQIMTRNACRNPWQDIINARVGKTFTVARQSIELTWDIYNLPNLLDRNWGLYKQVTTFEDADILQAANYNPGAQRFVYQYFPQTKQVNLDFGQSIFEPSVWRMQIGARYAF